MASSCDRLRPDSGEREPLVVLLLVDLVWVLTWGVDRSRALVSMIFSLTLARDEVWLVDIDDEFGDMTRNREGGQRATPWRVDASGGAVGWVVGAWDVLSAHGNTVLLTGVVDDFEYFVDALVSASPRPPAFHNASVIAEDFDALLSLIFPGNGRDEKEKSNRLGPPNVAPLGLPARDEPPSSPPFANRDSDSSFRACVGEGTDV